MENNKKSNLNFVDSVLNKYVFNFNHSSDKDNKQNENKYIKNKIILNVIILAQFLMFVCLFPFVVMVIVGKFIYEFIKSIFIEFKKHFKNAYFEIFNEVKQFIHIFLSTKSFLLKKFDYLKSNQTLKVEDLQNDLIVYNYASNYVAKIINFENLEKVKILILDKNQDLVKQLISQGKISEKEEYGHNEILTRYSNGSLTIHITQEDFCHFVKI